MKYFTFPISEHLERTPEGFLVARDAVIARTGWQQYLASEIDSKVLEDIGVDPEDKDRTIDVYRSPEELFSDSTIQSIEGKPVTYGHPENNEFVRPENAREMQYGHVQNVRRGEKPLENGEYPLLADIYITSEPLLSDVKNGVIRELSLGYSFNYEKKGNRLEQKDILVNHCALVERGRGGREVRIYDSAPEKKILATKNDTVKIENKGVSRMKLTWKSIFGAGLKAHAAEAAPEELADVVLSAGRAFDSDAEDAKKESSEHDFITVEGKPHPIRKSPKYKPGKVGERYRYRPGKKWAERRERLRSLKRKRRATDADAYDYAHHCLDRCIYGEAEDTDIDELLDLLEQYFEEEKEEPEHAEDAHEHEHEREHEEEDSLELEEAEQEPKISLDNLKKFLDGEPDEGDAEEEEENVRHAEDEDEKAEKEDEEEEEGEEHHGKDRHVARDAAIAVLKDLRPIVARRSEDHDLRKWYNRAAREVARRPASGKNGYREVCRSAVSHDGAPKYKTEAEYSAELDAMFAQLRKEGMK
jgi:hypothetical protein